MTRSARAPWFCEDNLQFAFGLFGNCKEIMKTSFYVRLAISTGLTFSLLISGCVSNSRRESRLAYVDPRPFELQIELLRFRLQLMQEERTNWVREMNERLPPEGRAWVARKAERVYSADKRRRDDILEIEILKRRIRSLDFERQFYSQYLNADFFKIPRERPALTNSLTQ
jgi:hypothetical protein